MVGGSLVDVNNDRLTYAPSNRTMAFTPHYQLLIAIHLPNQGWKAELA